MKRLLLALALAIPVAAHAASGNPDDYVRYLIPVIQRDLRGANGSVWTSELKFRNRGSGTILLVGSFCGPLIDPCPPSPFPVQPGTTVDLVLFPRGDGADGAFLYVQKTNAAPAITMRVRDTSANATSFGTEIHLPRTDEFQSQVDLIGIPTAARYRGTLRIYGTTAAPQQVRVRTYDDINGAVLSDERVTLSGIVNIVADPLPLHPAYAQLDAIPASVLAADAQRIRIVVEGQESPIWAFVTVTDNVTQLTSTITPNR